MSDVHPPGDVTFREAVLAETTFELWDRVTRERGMVPLLCVCSLRLPGVERLPLLPHAGSMGQEEVRALLVAALARIDSGDLVAYDVTGRPC